MKITVRDGKFFKLASAAADLSTFHHEKVGCVITLRNEVISVGYNRNKTHPLQAQFAAIAGRPEAIWLHAEMSALLKLNSNDDNSLCKLYVSRRIKNGDLALAKPCEICTEAIKAYGIREIFYTTTRGYAREYWT